MSVSHVTVGSWFDTNRRQIEEIFGDSIHHFSPELDRFFEGIMSSSMGLKPKGLLGRDLKLIRHFREGLTGEIDGGIMTSHHSLYGDSGNVNAGSQMFFQNPTQSYPTGLGGPKHRTYEFHCGLSSRNTGLALSLEELTADVTDAVLGNVVKPILTEFGRNLAQAYINDWWVNQNDNYRLCTIPTGGVTFESTAGGTNNVLVVNITLDNGATDRFFQGQRVDVYTSAHVRKNDSQASAANQTRETRVNAVVMSVDELQGVIKIFAPVAVNWSAGTGLQGGAAVATNYITLANIRLADGNFHSTAGINHYLKPGNGTGSLGDASYDNANCILGVDRIGTVGEGTIDVTQFPRHKSAFFPSFGALTESNWKMILRLWHVAKHKIGQQIDCWCASEGTILAYEDQKIPMWTIDRTNRASSLKNEGTDGKLTIQLDTRTYTVYESTWIERGTMYGLKKGGNNWKRLMPSRIPASTGNPNAASYVPFEFVVPALTDGKLSRFPILDSNNRLGNFVQMPGTVRMQIVPEQFAGVKMTGVSTKRIRTTS